MQNVRKFVKWDVPALESLRGARAFQCMEKLNAGGKLSREEKDNLYTDGGHIRVMGWDFDFTPYMKTYLVKLKYYGWQEVRAFDKTHIQHAHAIAHKSHILRIIDITEDQNA